jgi:hypothetical protein
MVAGSRRFVCGKIGSETTAKALFSLKTQIEWASIATRTNLAHNTGGDRND